MPATSYTNEYRLPDHTQAPVWSSVINAMITGNISEAQILAGEIGYRIILITDTVSQPIKDYYFLEKHPDSLNYWGTYVFNFNASRKRLGIQAPHPLADIYTGRQGFHIFKNTDAYFFSMSGTHRCNNTDPSSCSGRTSACYGLSDAPFRISDQAHSNHSAFQITTAALLKHNPDMIIIQPHGFNRSEGDPDLILSNGTRFTPRTDYLALLRDSISGSYPFLSFRLVHLDWTWNKLTGTTNTQGRLINGSLNPCIHGSGYTSGNFLHIEQALYTRIPRNWHIITDAIKKVIPRDPAPVMLAAIKAQKEDDCIALSWETSSEENNYGFEVQYKSGETPEWQTGGFVYAFNKPSEYVFKIYEELQGTVYLRLKQLNTNGSFNILPAVKYEVPLTLSYKLHNNYPNPFNPSTVISFEIPAAAEVELSVYNLLGEKVAVIVKEILGPGLHKYSYTPDGPSGIYFYKLSSAEFNQTKKLIYIK